MKNYLIIAYFFIAVINLLGIKLEIGLMEYASRFTLMLVLMVMITVSWVRKKEKIYFLSMLGLLFAWTGDILFILGKFSEGYLLYSYVFYLATHVAYIFMCYYAQTDTENTPNRIFIISRIVILAFAGGAFLNVLWPKLVGYQLYIALSAVIIILLGVFAVLRRERTSANSFSFIYGGVLMFIVSDGMIAVSQFLHSFSFQQELILITYVLAQFFIVRGAIEHQRFLHQTEE